MSRPKKCRKICGIPKCCQFGPTETIRQGTAETEQNAVEMTFDEYETIRLIDYLGYNQETCAHQMGVARTTVQAVYNEARKKLARVLIEERNLNIRGGNYVVCPRAESCVSKKGCGHGGCGCGKE